MKEQKLTQESLSPLVLFPDCLRMWNCDIHPATGGRKESLPAFVKFASFQALCSVRFSVGRV